jgi:hypothetical protein
VVHGRSSSWHLLLGQIGMLRAPGGGCLHSAERGGAGGGGGAR